MVFTILVVGDVHGFWDDGSESSVRALNPDALFFVGDFAEDEATTSGVEVVETVAKFAAVESDSGRAVCAVLGNHEAMQYSLKPKVGPAVPIQTRELLRPYNPCEQPRQVGPVSIVGGRPLSWGGGDWFFSHMYQGVYGIRDLAHSAELIRGRVDDTDEQRPIAFLSHNGAAGLGSAPGDICGNDYEHDAAANGRGDRGDPDLTNAIEYARSRGRRVLFVAHGHFHDRLQRGQGLRKMCVVDDAGTVHVNAAYVPRIRVENGERLHNFTRIVLTTDKEPAVESVSVLWTASSGKLIETKNVYPAVVS